MGWLISRYKHMVYTAAYRITRNREDAEEVGQDSFVKAFAHLAGFSGGSRFSTWLFSITYRSAISHLRKRRERTEALDDLGKAEPNGWDPRAGEATDRQRALELALARLPEEDAAIVSFFYLEEMSVEEIVTVTGLTASNVKVKLHRGRKKLLDVLNTELRGEARTLLTDHA